MADDTEMGLKVTLAAEPGNTEAVLGSLHDALVKVTADMEALHTASEKAGATVTTHGKAHDIAGTAVSKHAAAQNFFGASISKTTTVTNEAARVMSALGFNTAAATERVQAFGEGLDALGSAAAPLLVIGAAVLVVAEGFNLLAAGVKHAADEQVNLKVIETAIRNQGGAWAIASEEVDKFAKAVSRSTIYSKGEAIDALRDLTAKQISLADSEKIVAVATDLAAGTHRTLADAVNLLSQSEAGRTRGLIMADPALKAVIEKTHSFNDVLDAISKHYAGQGAEAADTFAGKQQVLKNRFEELGETLGIQLLPLLSQGVDVISALEQILEQQIPTWISWGANALKGGQDVIAMLKDIEKFMQPVTTGLNDLVRDFNQLGKNAHNYMADDNWYPNKDNIEAYLAGDGYKNKGGASGGQAYLSDHGGESGGPGRGGVNGSGINAQGGPSREIILEAIHNAAKGNARLEAMMIAVGTQETGLGQDTSNYNARTGRDRDGNRAVGYAQLDPASGYSRATLDRVATDPVEGARIQAEMLNNVLKTSNGNVIRAIEAYGPHIKDSSGQLVPDLKYVTAVTHAMNAQGRGPAPLFPTDWNNAITDSQIRQEETHRLSVGRIDDARKRALQHDARLGGADKQSPDIAMMDDAMSKARGRGELQTDLDKKLKELTSSEIAYKAAVDTSTSSQSRNAAQLLYKNKIVADAHQAITLLGTALVSENKLRNELAPHLTAEYAAYENARAAYNKYATEVNAGGPITHNQTAKLKDLNEEIKKTKSAYDITNAAISTNDANMKANTAAVDANLRKLGEVNALNGAEIRAYVDATSARQQNERDERATYQHSLTDQIEYWKERLAILKQGLLTEANLKEIAIGEGKLGAAETSKSKFDFDIKKKKEDLEAGVRDANATYSITARPYISSGPGDTGRRQSIAQEAAYYAERHRLTLDADGNETTESMRYYETLKTLEKEYYKAQYDEQTAFTKLWQSRETGWLDDILVKHKSLRDVLKSIWDDIFGDFVKMIEKMILKTALFKAIGPAIQSALSGIGGGGASGLFSGAEASTNAGAGGGFGSIFSLFGSGGGAKPDGTANNPFNVSLSGSSISKLTDVSSVFTGGGGSGLAGLSSASAGIQSNDLSFLGGDAYGPGTYAPGAVTKAPSFLSRAGGGVIEGLAVAQMVSGITHGNQQNAAIGGALAGFAGIALHANPLIGLGIDIAMSAIGGMIGPHWGPPENYPDRSDTQRYRQTIQNLVGGTSGDNAYSLDPSIASITHDKSEASFLQDMFKKGKPSWMSDAEFKQASGFFGTDPNAVLQHGVHIGDLSYGSGTHMNYVEAQTLATKILNEYQKAGGDKNSPIPIFDVKRSMPNYNVGSLISGGMFDPATGKTIGGPPPAGAYPWNDPRIPPNGIHPIEHAPIININIGSVDNQQRVLQISRALNDVYRLNIGGATNSLNGYAL